MEIKSCNQLVLHKYFLTPMNLGWVGPVTSSTTLYVSGSGGCGDKKPCYSTMKAAMDVAGDGVIKARQGTLKEAPTNSGTGNVVVSGGWNADFSDQTGVTEIYAPKVTGSGGVKVEPNVKIIPKP